VAGSGDRPGGRDRADAGAAARAAEAAHFQGRPGQAEQELAVLAADAASDAERARVALLRLDNAFFLRGGTDLRLIDDVADAITEPLWRGELLARRFFVVGANSGPRAAVEAGSAMLRRSSSEPLTAAM